MDIKASRFSLASMISKWRSALSQNSDSFDQAEAVVPPPPEPQVATSWQDGWQADTLLEGFETRTFAMPNRLHLPEEGEGSLIATLVRHHKPGHRRAVLYIHGWNEYFFQRHIASFFEDLGYDFYAIDLHRYGRSLQSGELFGYMEDVSDYYEELDACVDLIRQDHAQIVLSGHSTGGLIASVYVADRRGSFVGLILNSPWIDMQGSALFRALTPPLARGLALASPTLALPMSENDLYGRSLHSLYQGEWDYDLGLKRVDSQPVRPGWTKAIVNAHDRVGEGLHIDCPILVITSARSSDPKEWTDEVTSTDLAIDVDRVAARVHLLGWHVTLVRLAGALHDVSLSTVEVRERFFDEIRRWELAYVRARTAQERVSGELDAHN